MRSRWSWWILAVLAAGCLRRDDALRRLNRQLADCSDRAACALAVKELRGLPQESRESADGAEARIRALRHCLVAVASWPEMDRAFLEGAGMTPERALGTLEEEARSLERLPGKGPGSGARDVRTILEALREPRCDRIQALQALEQGAGRFSDVAWLAEAGLLAHLLGAIDPLQVQGFGDTARIWIGCTLPPDAEDAEVLVAARDRLGQAIGYCPRAAGSAPGIREVCDRLEQAFSRWELPLHWSGLSRGEVAGALLPRTRGGGLSFSPPWVFVISAGRLLRAEAPVIPAGQTERVPEKKTTLLDFRTRHGVQDVRLVVSQTLKDHAPVEIRGRKLIPLAVDRSETFQDLAEVLEALLAETDAVPALALIPEGGRSLSFLMLNWRFSERPLWDVWGTRRAFLSGPKALSLSLSPFAMSLESGDGEREVELLPTEDGESRGLLPLRAAYEAAVSLAGPEGERSGRLAVQGSVSVGLLVQVLEALAARVDRTALAHESLFASAPPLRDRGGPPQALLPALVLRLQGMPAE